MSAWKWVIAGMLAVRMFSPDAALAFQQTPLPQAAPAQSKAAPEAGSLTLEIPQVAGSGQAAPATEKTDKGLLGVLPRKLDFGLELLYAPEGTGGGAAVLPAEPTQDDLTIRGSVKKRF
ncbi:MAG: hypothetical protein VX871_08515 [Pseudomonadota bacterium]|nr:hypothetical protein [Pseudomonadota bacterium]